MPCVMCHSGNPMRNIHGMLNVKLRIELETSSDIRSMNYHNVKSETNQPICNSYKRIFYGRRFHPYIQNTWYLNHLICISKKHCGYFEQLNRKVEILPTSIILPYLSQSHTNTSHVVFKSSSTFLGLSFCPICIK